MKKQEKQKDYDDTFEDNTVKKELDALKELVTGNTEAIKELTTTVGDLVKENSKWFRAGRFNQ